jgi:hypothetical protein
MYEEKGGVGEGFEIVAWSEVYNINASCTLHIHTRVNPPTNAIVRVETCPMECSDDML